MKYDAKYEVFGDACQKCDCRMGNYDRIFFFFFSYVFQITYFDPGKHRCIYVIAEPENAIVDIDF